MHVGWLSSPLVVYLATSQNVALFSLQHIAAHLPAVGDHGFVPSICSALPPTTRCDSVSS